MNRRSGENRPRSRPPAGTSRTRVGVRSPGRRQNVHANAGTLNLAYQQEPPIARPIVDKPLGEERCPPGIRTNAYDREARLPTRASVTTTVPLGPQRGSRSSVGSNLSCEKPPRSKSKVQRLTRSAFGRDTTSRRPSGERSNVENDAGSPTSCTSVPLRVHH